MLATMKAHEGDVVELAEDLPKYGRRRGDRGIVIEAFDQPTEAYDIEFEGADGEFLGFGYSVRPEQIAKVDSMTQEAFSTRTALLKEGAKPDGRGRARGAISLDPSASVRRHKGIAATYRKRTGHDTWHFCSNCSNWPTKGESVEQSSKPMSGELCNECMRKQTIGQCS